MMMGPAPENAGLAIKHFDWPPTISDPPSTSWLQVMVEQLASFSEKYFKMRPSLP